jgi:hypothetical protein
MRPKLLSSFSELSLTIRHYRLPENKGIITGISGKISGIQLDQRKLPDAQRPGAKLHRGVVA